MIREQYDILMRGIEIWNKWRKETSSVRIDLSEADLSEADLSEADLSRVDLSESNLSRANLSRANLSESNLYRANFSRANLSESNLSRANLSESNLSESNLIDSNIIDTCLDPLAKIYEEDVREWCKEFNIGIEEDGTIYAYRTKRSQIVGNTVYSKGIHTAPYFSVDKYTACHPGIYFSSKEWLEKIYIGEELVRIRTHALACCAVNNKCRARWIEVLDD
jgi:hypothetical protein